MLSGKRTALMKFANRPTSGRLIVPSKQAQRLNYWTAMVICVQNLSLEQVIDPIRNLSSQKGFFRHEEGIAGPIMPGARRVIAYRTK